MISKALMARFHKMEGSGPTVFDNIQCFVDRSFLSTTRKKLSGLERLDNIVVRRSGLRSKTESVANFGCLYH